MLLGSLTLNIGGSRTSCSFVVSDSQGNTVHYLREDRCFRVLMFVGSWLVGGAAVIDRSLTIGQELRQLMKRARFTNFTNKT